MRNAAVALIMVPCAMSAQRAGAADFAYQASLSAGHSDNIGRTVAARQDENIAAAGLQFSGDRVGPRLQTHAVGNVAYYDYLDDTYDSELIGNLAADATFALVPERLEWIVADNFGQVLRDPFVASTPENRENINYFTTGPQLILPLGSQTHASLGGRYSLVDYEDSPFDSQSVSADLGLVRALSSATSVGLFALAEQVEYDESALDQDYDRDEAFIRLDASGARTTLALDVGYTWLDQKSAARSDDDGWLLRLDASRRLSASSIATLSAGHEFSNSGSAFAEGQTSGGIALESTSGRQTAQPFTLDYARLAWDFARERNAFGVWTAWSKQSYEGASSLNQKLLGVGAHYNRQLSARTALDAGVSYGEGSFETDTDYDELTGTLAFSWHLSSRLSLIATTQYYDRSDEGVAGNVTENRYWLSISYGRGTPRSQYAPAEFPIDARQ